MAFLKSLSPRLQAVHQSVLTAHKANNYHCIWDCGCDHGYLGAKLLQGQLSAQINFVDQVESLTATLRQHLQLSTNSNFQIITGNAAKLKLAHDKKHLVILAGLGGELSTEITSGIIEGNHSDGKNGAVDFLYCPSTSVFQLRQYLAEQQFSLLDEQIVQDNKRCYEVINARANGSSSPQVSSVGVMWQSGNDMHKNYLAGLIKLQCQRQKGKNSAHAVEILDLYQQCYKQYF